MKSTEEFLEDPTERVLHSNDYNVCGENDSWVYFERGNPVSLDELTQKLSEFERALLENPDLELPDELLGLYKIDLTVPPDKVERALELLATCTNSAPLDGKVLKDNCRTNPHIPTVVLYIYDPKIGNLVEFATQLSKFFEQEFGEDDYTPDMLMAQEIGPYVHLSQGNFASKVALKERDENAFYELFDNDGSLYRGTSMRFLEKTIRTDNQLRIYESYIDYVDMPILERLTAFQKEGLAGTEVVEPVTLGVRTNLNIKLGRRDNDLAKKFESNPNYVLQDYYPPSYERLPEILESIEAFYTNYMESTGGSLTREQANRLCAVLYIGLLGTHPLEDGNGQSTMNIISSVLMELGAKDYFVRTPYLAKSTTVQKLVSTENLAIDVYTQPIMPPDNSMGERDVLNLKVKKATRAYSASTSRSLSWMFSVEGASFLHGYLDGGSFSYEDVPEKVRHNVEIFCEAMKNMEEYFDKNRTEDLVGDTKLTFQKLTELHEAALHGIKENIQ
ncbi:MAG: hypothetical protein ACD_24C00407G0004 [uncultured bacterium]|nr:MAG: hypothetical protein ACD_24C00407G0004 [uncultured bacterium]